jgi:hypothetical protein
MHEDTKLSQGPFPENTTNLHQTRKQNVKQNNKSSGIPTERTTHKSPPFLLIKDEFLLHSQCYAIQYNRIKLYLTSN